MVFIICKVFSMMNYPLKLHFLPYRTYSYLCIKCRSVRLFSVGVISAEIVRTEQAISSCHLSNTDFEQESKLSYARIQLGTLRWLEALCE